jgi:hypothetical protein
MKYLLTRLPTLLLAAFVGLIVASSAFGQATIVIQNADAAGVGFNDMTAVAPVGGNSGTTLGAQRLITFQAAANIWGASISSTPSITIHANWAPLTCSASTAILGQAGNASNVYRDFSGSVPGFWYGNALANAISGFDRNGSSPEINATFNINLGNSGCLPTSHWYYGLDGNHGSTGIDLVAVLLHEFAHGLGFQTFTSSSTGAQAFGFPSIYDRFLFDKTAGKTWAQMTADAERQASAINTNKLVWNGPQVTSDVPLVLTGAPQLKVNSPPSIAGTYAVGTADFGAHLSSAGVTAGVVQATPNDGCSAIGGSVSGKIALIDRGTCTFVSKTKSAQDAGAVGVIIVDNVSSSTPPGMGGSDSTITIPAVSITMAGGNTIKAQLGSGVNATLQTDPSSTAGADSSGHPLLYTPNPIVSGSSVSHWDTSETPNQLMEPNISNDLTHSVTTPQDLTLSLLKDIGWPTGTPPPAPSPTPTPSPPPNDNFANAQVVSGCSGSVTGTNIAATKEAGEPNNPDSPTSTRSVWYQWQAPSTGSATIDTHGSDFDTVLAVYTGSSVNALTLVTNGSNDDAVPGSDLTSTVTISVTQGTTYRIAVNGYDNGGDGGDTGNIKVNWSEGGCVDTWQPTTLTSGQVGSRTWTYQGRTYAYIKLTFPDAGYRVNNWGQAVQSGINFTADATVEKFTGASVQAVKTTAQIYDLGPLSPGSYNFVFKNSGTVVTTTPFTVSSTPPPANPIDDPREFVRWQYKDFLSREPDGPGWDHWTGEITMCSNPANRNAGETEAQCVERKRANTSAAFFLSPEFQNTGYFVLRVYRGSLGRMPFFGGSGDNTKDEFTRDAATVSAGIVVNDHLDPNVINANKQAFVNQFVTRADFLAIYGGLNDTQYVDKLFQTTVVTPTTTERNQLIIEAGSAGGRASVLFKVVDGTTTITDGALVFNTPYGKAFYDQQFNPGFVQMEYFGYMRRDPDDGGYTFWLGKLNTFGNWVDAQMVLAFINSPEYRARFGQP